MSFSIDTSQGSLVWLGPKAPACSSAKSASNPKKKSKKPEGEIKNPKFERPKFKFSNQSVTPRLVSMKIWGGFPLLLRGSIRVKAISSREFLLTTQLFRPLKKPKSRVPPAGLQSLFWLADCCLFFAPERARL